MKLTDISLKNPAAVLLLAALCMALGVITLTRLPIQLFPNIEQPVLGIQTSWRSASPAEVESEITDPIEEVMQGLPGLEEMQSWSNAGNSWVNLTFQLGADMDRTLIDVISRLNRLRPLPADAERPQVVMNGGGNSGDTLIYLFSQFREDSTLSRQEYVPFIERNIIPQLEAVEGVARIDVQAGAGLGQQLQIEFDPVLAAQLGVDLNQLSLSVGRTTDSSGGYMEVGRRRYMVNFMGHYDPSELESRILAWREGRPVTLGDVATVQLASPAPNAVVYQNGNPAIGMQVQREAGANVLATIEALTVELDRLNAGILAENGISIQKSFDPSVFINRAISLLSTNLLIGIFLAIAVLWLFLRQARATLLVALTVPICLLTTVIMLGLAGRTVNVISLAGLAFATGMVMDAAIVVLENIFRQREAGENPTIASLVGASEVWGALIASTATTVAIFLPILFLKDVEGQLFADLALTIAIGVGISLIVAVTVLPVLARQFLGTLTLREEEQGGRLVNTLMASSKTPLRRIATIVVLISSSLALSWTFLPNLNYLPPVKRDAVDAFMIFPSGSNVKTVEEEVVKVIVDRLQPYMDGTKEPALKNYYVITWPNGQGGNIGVRAKDQSRVKELEAIVRDEVMVGFPDVFTFAQQGNLFGGFGGGGGVELHVHSRDLDGMRDLAMAGINLVPQMIPGSQARPNPDPNVITPELRLTPNDRRLAEVGYTRNELARMIRTLGDGLWLGEYFDGEQRVDMILKSTGELNPEDLAAIPLATPLAGMVPLSELVTIERGVGPSNIQRRERKRTITFDISQPDGMPLEDMVRLLKEKVEPELRALLPADASITYGGSADALDRAVLSLSQNFVLALMLLFMILAALFKSTRDALMVVISIPLATVGGVLALTILNTFSFAPLDLLTMIGFIILLGLVVNNAILLVAQTRAGEAEGLSRDDAVARALTLRIRPIFMSTLTSIMGMLPLVLFPGAGSDIYRGMAATIVGGMSVSTLFTLVLLPALLRSNASDILPFLNTSTKPVSQPAE